MESDDAGKGHKESPSVSPLVLSHTKHSSKKCPNLCEGVGHTARTAEMGYSPKFQQEKGDHGSLRTKRTTNKLPGALFLASPLKPRLLKFWSMCFLYLSTGSKAGSWPIPEFCHAGNRINSQPRSLPPWGQSGDVGRRFALCLSIMDFTVN